MDVNWHAEECLSQVVHVITSLRNILVIELNKVIVLTIISLADINIIVLNKAIRNYYADNVKYDYLHLLVLDVTKIGEIVLIMSIIRLAVVITIRWIFRLPYLYNWFHVIPTEFLYITL